MNKIEMFLKVKRFLSHTIQSREKSVNLKFCIYHITNKIGYVDGDVSLQVFQRANQSSYYWHQII